MSDWESGNASPLEDLEALAEQIRNGPSIRPACEIRHPWVKHIGGKVMCMTCGEGATPAPEQLCDCLERGCLVFERDGMYHAKPGPCT